MEPVRRFLWSWPFYGLAAFFGVLFAYGWNIDKIVGKVGAWLVLGVIGTVIVFAVVLAKRAVVSGMRWARRADRDLQTRRPAAIDRPESEVL